MHEQHFPWQMSPNGNNRNWIFKTLCEKCVYRFKNRTECQSHEALLHSMILAHCGKVVVKNSYSEQIVLLGKIFQSFPNSCVKPRNPFLHLPVTTTATILYSI